MHSYKRKSNMTALKAAQAANKALAEEVRAGRRPLAFKTILTRGEMAPRWTGPLLECVARLNDGRNVAVEWRSTTDWKIDCPAGVRAEALRVLQATEAQEAFAALRDKMAGRPSAPAVSGGFDAPAPSPAADFETPLTAARRPEKPPFGTAAGIYKQTVKFEDGICYLGISLPDGHARQAYLAPDGLWDEETGRRLIVDPRLKPKIVELLQELKSRQTDAP